MHAFFTAASLFCFLINVTMRHRKLNGDASEQVTSYGVTTFLFQQGFGQRFGQLVQVRWALFFKPFVGHKWGQPLIIVDFDG
jgi:hypothetical protein